MSNSSEWTWSNVGSDPDDGRIFFQPSDGLAHCVAIQPRLISEQEWRSVAPVLASSRVMYDSLYRCKHELAAGSARQEIEELVDEALLYVDKMRKLNRD